MSDVLSKADTVISSSVCRSVRSKTRKKTTGQKLEYVDINMSYCEPRGD